MNLFAPAKDEETTGLVHEDDPCALHPARMTNKSGRCLTIWLVALNLTSLLWAIWATFLVIDMGSAMDMQQTADFNRRIHFVASPTENHEHYERLSEIGSEGAYDCVYVGVLATCHNEDSVIEIWFTPEGPLYKREQQSTDQRRLTLRTWPFGTTQYYF